MDTYPALLLPSWASAIEAVGHATSARVDDLVDSILVAPQQPPRAPAPDLSRFAASRESFREFVEARGAWARAAFACLLQGTRPRRARRGRPLYRFAGDRKAGDRAGENAAGTWHTVRP